mgnify:CR=1 FL=1
MKMNELRFPIAAPVEIAAAALQHLAAVTPELECRIRQVTDRLPPHHLSRPENGERFDDCEAAYTRLQDYAFTKELAIIVRSGRSDRAQYECVYHKDDTSNWR